MSAIYAPQKRLTFTRAQVVMSHGRPQLTYHGFRFVEINTTNAPNIKITNASVSMIHFASAVEQVSHVHFSSDTLNKLQAMALGSQRSNLMTLPTDCDQRDERLGWLGDANLSGESFSLNFNMASLFQFWTANVAMPELHTDGSLPDVAPFVRFGNRPADVSWSAALPNYLYTMWKAYGDLSIYKQGGGDEAVAMHVANLGVQASKGLDHMRTPYGDWCPPPAKMGGGQGVKPSPPSHIRLLVSKRREASGRIGDGGWQYECGCSV